LIKKDKISIHEVRGSIEKIQKKIEIARADPEFDKQALSVLYEKRKELFENYQNFVRWQMSQKVT